MIQPSPNGYLASPPNGKGPGVLVLHAWWGLNETIKSFCARLAAAGFTALAPDLYHGSLAVTIPEAEVLSSALNIVQARREVAAAAEWLRANQEQPIAVLGFSLGAYYALDLSIISPELIGDVVVYYGTGPEDFTGSQASYLGHFAERDPYEPWSNVAAMKKAVQQAGRPCTIHRYPGTGHWFCEPDRADAYNASAAELAWQRTLEFLSHRSAE